MGYEDLNDDEVDLWGAFKDWLKKLFHRNSFKAILMIVVALALGGCYYDDNGGVDRNQSGVSSWLEDEHAKKFAGERMNVTCIERRNASEFECYGKLVANPSETYTFEVICDNEYCHYTEYRD